MTDLAVRGWGSRGDIMPCVLSPRHRLFCRHGWGINVGVRLRLRPIFFVSSKGCLDRASIDPQSSQLKFNLLPFTSTRSPADSGGQASNSKGRLRVKTPAYRQPSGQGWAIAKAKARRDVRAWAIAGAGLCTGLSKTV